MTALRVLIIGCGNIAGAFDLGRSAAEPPFTHAGALKRDDRFILAACVEPDENRRHAFMRTWGVTKGFSSLGEASDSKSRFDIISICSPTTCHALDLEQALRMEPKLIFCEKPVTASVAETDHLVKKCREAGILLAVNHTRRWMPDILKLRKEISENKWGRLRSIVGFYNKGILNNGSHMVDLLHLLVGPMDTVAVGKPIFDFFPDDPTVPAWLEGAQGESVHLVCGHAQDYAIFELHLMFSHGLLIMEDGGFFWRERNVKDSGVFTGYRILDAGIRRAGAYSMAMLTAMDNIHGAISHGDTLASTGESALAAQRVCEGIKLKALTL